MAEGIRQCEQCRHRLPPGAGYCPRCGYPVRGAVERSPSSPETDRFQPPFRGPSDWQLTLVRPDGDQTSRSLTERLTIGRSPENDLQLQDSQVSRVHAVIEQSAGGFALADLGSSNGTYLNRTRVHSPVKLRVGDTITIGHHRLLVQRRSATCGNCARPVSVEDIYCMHCGQPLSGLLEPARPGPLLADEEHLAANRKALKEIAPEPAFRQKLPEYLSPQPTPEPVEAVQASRPISGSRLRAELSDRGRPGPAKRLGASAAPKEVWLRSCAVLAVAGLCIVAAVAAGIYWLIVTGQLTLN